MIRLIVIFATIAVAFPELLKCQVFSSENFILPPGLTYIRCMETVDINSDGLDDIIIGGGGEFNLYYKLNMDSGQFGFNVKIPVQKKYVYSVNANDFDSDGDIDLIILQSDDLSYFTPPFFETIDHTLTLFLNNGQGSFDQHLDIYNFSGFPSNEVHIVDQNNDNYPDIVYDNKLIYNTLGTSFQLQIDLPGQLIWDSKLRFEDINYDGYVDFIRENQQQMNKVLYVGNNNGFSQDSVLIILYDGDLESGFGDVNNDGLMDFVAYNSQTSRYNLYLCQFDLSFVYSGTLGNIVTTLPEGVILKDLNQDGDVDLFVKLRNFNTYEFAYSLKNNLTWNDLDNIDFGGLYLEGFLSDTKLGYFDSGNSIDLLLAVNPVNQGIFLVNNIIETNRKMSFVDFKYEMIDTLDFNGDNILDVAFAERYIFQNGVDSIRYFILTGDEEQILIPAIIENDSSRYCSPGSNLRAFGHLNNDNYSDAYELSYDANGVYIYQFLNNQAGRFVASDTNFFPFNVPISNLDLSKKLPTVYSNYLSGDGERYILIFTQLHSVQLDRKFVCFSHTINGGFVKVFDWTISPSENFNVDFTKGLEIKDVNYDGNMDVVFLDRITHSIRILLFESTSTFISNNSIELISNNNPFSWNPNICKLNDIDLDGNLDIIVNLYVSANQSSELIILRGANNLQYSSPLSIISKSNLLISDFEIVDVNGDLLPDIIIKWHSPYYEDLSGELGVLVNLGNLNFEWQVISETICDGSYVAIGFSYTPNANENIIVIDNNHDSAFDIVLSDGNKVSVFNGENPLFEHELFGIQELFIYPNPATNLFQFKNIDCKVAEFKLFANDGRLVSYGKVDAGSQVSLENLDRGSYLVNIICEKGHKFLKLIKM